MHTRREILRTTAMGTAIGLGALSSSSTATASGASFGDGVNLQPSYFCNGDQDLGWDLMDQAPDIQTVRVEIEPPSMGESQATIEDARRWLEEADSRGYDVIATYHHHLHNGSPDPATLQNAADWWVEHYATLSQDASFTINMMNEWGNHEVTADEYASAYDEAISTVREGTDYAGPIVCDAPGWGQGTHRLAEAVTSIDDDDLILSAHVYPSGWNATTGQTFQASHLDVLDETDYPCMIGEFGSKVDGSADWSAMVDHAKEMGWPVVGWAWNGDGGGMNVADPYWGDRCDADSYTRSSYFDTIYAKLDGGSGSSDTTAPSAPSGLAVTSWSVDTINVEWGAATDSGGSGLDHYEVTVDGSQYATVPAGRTTASVEDLDAGTTYEIGVVAVDAAGNRSPAATVTKATERDPQGNPCGVPDGQLAPPLSDGTQPIDLDGDHLVEDLNENCRHDSDDVVVLFENMGDPAVTNNYEWYNYNGNQRADFDDLVQFFEML